MGTTRGLLSLLRGPGGNWGHLSLQPPLGTWSRMKEKKGFVDRNFPAGTDWKRGRKWVKGVMAEFEIVPWEEENPFNLTPKGPNKTQNLQQKEPRRSGTHFYARAACKGHFDQTTGEAAFPTSPVMEHRDQNPRQPFPDKDSLTLLHPQHQTSDSCPEIPTAHLKPATSRPVLTHGDHSPLAGDGLPVTPERQI